MSQIETTKSVKIVISVLCVVLSAIGSPWLALQSFRINNSVSENLLLHFLIALISQAFFIWAIADGIRYKYKLKDEDRIKALMSALVRFAFVISIPALINFITIQKSFMAYALFGTMGIGLLIPVVSIVISIFAFIAFSKYYLQEAIRVDDARLDTFVKQHKQKIDGHSAKK
jgi:uncharacterized membrane protein